MSEQPTPLPDDFRTWLAARGAEAYALVWVAAPQEPADWVAAQAPRAGESGIARTGADLTRIALQALTHGRPQALRRWLQMDDGRRAPAIVTAGPGGLREHTPGDLAAALIRDPAGDQAQLTDLLAGWLQRRHTEAPHGGERAWMTAGAAWAVHLRTFGSLPPLAVLTRILKDTGEHDEMIAEMVGSTALRVADLLDRLERPHRTRADLIKDWRTLEPLADGVPALAQTADWILDQIALRDAHAQQVRAVLEPDLTDHLRDRRADGRLPDAAVGALDAQRAAHLAQARATVRAYTAAACSGRGEEAQHLLDAFPAPARTLTVSGPAAAWRRASTTARAALADLAAQRAATTQDGTDLFADPELLHAQISYLAAREGQLHLMHDALGRLAHPTQGPRTLPEALAPVAAAQTERRVIEAFGTLERAAQALDGQISHHSRQPVPARQRATSDAEAELLITTRNALEHLAPATPLNEEYIRARLQAMARPATPAAPAPPAAHDEVHRQALAPGPGTPGIHR